jgi:DNA-binding transcriptional LysR family regulator
MNWDDVRVFLAVARSGQLLQAARRLGVNHATVGRRVSSLESALKAKLLERSTTGCALTPAGEEFLLAAERMEAEMLAVRASIAGADVEVSGTVRIGAPDGFGVAFLAPRLGALMDRFPDLTIQLVPVPRSFSLSRREADIVITVDRPEHGRLVARKLVDYTLALYASRDYLAAHGAPHQMSDLRAHRLVGYVQDILFSSSLDYSRALDRNWRARFECASALGQAEAVRAGVGIGILHKFIARRDPDLVQLLPDWALSRAYWTVYHESTRSLRRITAVSDFVYALVEQERNIFE